MFGKLGLEWGKLGAEKADTGYRVQKSTFTAVNYNGQTKQERRSKVRSTRQLMAINKGFTFGNGTKQETLQ